MTRPGVVEAFWYAIEWDVESLWKLDLKAEPMAVTDLIWHMDVPLWPLDGEGYRITPRQVLAEPDRYAAEYRRLLAADPAFPIEVTRLKGRWMILDGVHRLARASQAGRDSIMVRKVPFSLLRRLRPDASEW